MALRQPWMAIRTAQNNILPAYELPKKYHFLK
jgi:hypothetical protein